MEREILALRVATEKDALISDAVGKNVNEILEACKTHIGSCKEGFKSLANEPLLSEITAKAILSLIIHKPYLMGVYKSQIADIESLLLIK